MINEEGQPIQLAEGDEIDFHLDDLTVSIHPKGVLGHVYFYVNNAGRDDKCIIGVRDAHGAYTIVRFIGDLLNLSFKMVHEDAGRIAFQFTKI